MNVSLLVSVPTYSCGHPGWAGRQDIDEGTAKLLIKSCPPSRGLPTTADDLVGQINWKTTQQGVSQTESHHQPPTAATPIISSEERRWGRDDSINVRPRWYNYHRQTRGN